VTSSGGWLTFGDLFVFIMQNAFEGIREEIHAIRNLLSPVDLKLDSLDHKITASRITFESKTSELENKVAANSLRLSEQATQIAEHSDEIAEQSERIKRIELLLKMPQNLPHNSEKYAPAPVHEDKANPTILPPQTPGP
jgi:chromosome segregation ATPase